MSARGNVRDNVDLLCDVLRDNEQAVKLGIETSKTREIDNESIKFI